MNARELADARTLALDLACWSIEQTRGYRVEGVATKAHPADLVTELDRGIERHVRKTVRENFAHHAFVGEEFGGSPVAGTPTWYLDPVDGTTNLANGIPWTAFSLALAIDECPVLGVVAEPWQNAVFEAVSGDGARRNGVPLELPMATTLTGSVVATELAGHAHWPGMQTMAHGLAERYCTLRVMGSGTLALLGPADGRGSGAVVHRFSPIDHLAAVLIAREAGAVVLDHEGRRSLFPRSGGVLVAAPDVAEELLELWTSSRA